MTRQETTKLRAQHQGANPNAPLGLLLATLGILLFLALAWIPYSLLSHSHSREPPEDLLQEILRELKSLRTLAPNNTVTKALVTMSPVVDSNKDFKSILESLKNIQSSLMRPPQMIMPPIQAAPAASSGGSSSLTELKTILEKHNHEALAILVGFKQESWNEFQNLKKSFQTLESIKNNLFDPFYFPKKSLEIPEMSQELLNLNPNDTDLIFFIETSGKDFIRSRFVCGLESTAKAYPNSKIYLLIVYLPAQGLKVDKNEPLMTVLRHYKNIKVLRVDLDILFKGTILETFHKTEKLMSSQFLEVHTSDVVRAVVLHKYGGRYFDMDIINIKPIQHKQFVVYESKLPWYGFINGAFGLGNKNSKVGALMLEILASSFKPDDRHFNGPRVLSQAIKNYTGIIEATLMDDSNMKGFKKLNYESFLPIEYFELNLYFNETASDEVMERIWKVKDLWGLHIGNKISQFRKVKVGSKQPYSILAQQYCPRAYWSCYDEF